MSDAKKQKGGAKGQAQGSAPAKAQAPASGGPAPTPTQIDPGTVSLVDVLSGTVVGWAWRDSGSVYETWILMTGSPKYIAPPARAIRIEKNTTLCGPNGCATQAAFETACHTALGSNTANKMVTQIIQNGPF
jgi:hypothetical protein